MSCIIMIILHYILVLTGRIQSLKILKCPIFMLLFICCHLLFLSKLTKHMVFMNLCPIFHSIFCDVLQLFDDSCYVWTDQII